MTDIKSFSLKRDEVVTQGYVDTAGRFQLEDKDFYYGPFPENFRFGAGTAAYQIEGGWNEDGKGPSIWDHTCHQEPNIVDDGTTGDVACDSYHRYKEDVQLLKNMGANMYKFSISWARVLPLGTTEKINQGGVDYYNKLIDNLLENGVEPLVTLWHFDFPLAIAEKYEKQWVDENIVELFANYARFCFETFGDRVKHWLTINEPWITAIAGYDLGMFPPHRHEPGTDLYQVVHNAVKAHGLAYRIYEKEFKSSQRGKIGISIDCWGLLPADPNSKEDKEALDIAFQFKFGCVAHPLIYGCYPPAMREKIDRRSKAEGLSKSRLPEFDEKWTQIVKGSADFFGLNHYTCELVTPKGKVPEGIKKSQWSTGQDVGFDADQEIDRFVDPSWGGSMTWWLKVTPWALRPLLNMIKDNYKNIEIIIAENGYPDKLEVIDDVDRVNFFKSYVNETLKAIQLDGCNVTGYMAWALIDAWEWTSGKLVTFGIHSVDFSDPEMKRTPKASALALTKIYKDKGFLK